MTIGGSKSILKNEKIRNTIIKRKQKTMKKKYEKISAEILFFTRDAVSTSGGNEKTDELVSRTSMADIDDVYGFGWMSEVK